MIKIKLIIVMMLSMIDIAISQGCCTAGTSSLGGVDRSVIAKDNLSVMLGFDYNYLGSAYNSRNEISDPLNRTATVSYFSFQLEYGISEKVSVMGITNFNIRERNITVTSVVDDTQQELTFNGQGFGDIVLLGKYEIITPNFFSPLALAIGGGVKLPTGNFRVEDNGTRLAIDLQPGTGATDALLWSYLSNSFRSINLLLYGNLLYRYPGTNLEGYRVGDELLVVLGADYGVTEYFSLTLQLRSRFAEPDFAGGRKLPSTGSTSYDLYPYLNYIEGKFSLRIYTQIPLYRNMRGIQLTVSQVLAVQLQYFFDFSSNI
jgi:hypothetical protein